MKPDTKTSLPQIVAELSGLSVNDTTARHTARIIFGDNRRPQDRFNYTKLSEMFPGYKYDFGTSTYKGEEVGEGGYVYDEPGMYENVVLLDVESMHPTSIQNLELFGPEYTPKFWDLVQARLAIKHEDYDAAAKMLDGKLAPYLGSKESAKALSYALKIVINIVYGLTSARFANVFKDPRNVDNRRAVGRLEVSARTCAPSCLRLRDAAMKSRSGTSRSTARRRSVPRCLRVALRGPSPRSGWSPRSPACVSGATGDLLAWAARSDIEARTLGSPPRCCSRTPTTARASAARRCSRIRRTYRAGAGSAGHASRTCIRGAVAGGVRSRWSESFAGSRGRFGLLPGTRQSSPVEHMQRSTRRWLRPNVGQRRRGTARPPQPCPRTETHDQWRLSSWDE